jgi:hypothetical protein
MHHIAGYLHILFLSILTNNKNLNKEYGMYKMHVVQYICTNKMLYNNTVNKNKTATITPPPPTANREQRKRTKKNIIFGSVNVSAELWG